MKSTVGYLTMAFLPRNLPHAICNTEDQIYPSELKQLFLLYQRDKMGKFPAHVKHDMPFGIIQANVEGIWPQLWVLKIEEYLRLSNTDITVIWDEDDRFPPLYTLRMVQALEANPAKQVAWTLKNRGAKKGSFQYFQHECPIGCAVFRTGFLRFLMAWVVSEYPKKYSDGRRHNKKQRPRPTPNNPKRMSCGVLDNQICKRIIKKYPRKLLVADPVDAEIEVNIAGYDARYFEVPTGYRTYIQHKDQNSVKKDPAEDVE